MNRNGARARGGAMLVVMSLVASSALADGGDKKRAKELFDQGVAASDDGKWADALALFQRSDKLNPSLSVRFDIAATLRALGRYVEAKRTLKGILKDAPDWDPPLKPALKADVEKMLEEVKEKTVEVTIDVVPSTGAVQIDGADVKPRDDGTIEVDPGKHVFEVSAQGYETLTLARIVSKPIDVKLHAHKLGVVEKGVEVPEERPFYASGWFLGTSGVVVAGVVVVVLAVALQPKAPEPARAPNSTTGRTLPAAVLLRF